MPDLAGYCGQHLRNGVASGGSHVTLVHMSDRNRRVAGPIVGLIVGLMVLSACGSAGTTKSSAAQPTQADAATTTATDASIGPETSLSGSASEATNQADVASTGSATPAEGDESPAPSPADDGCSADNSATMPDNADGPAPAIPVRPESVGNLLPDLAVRRINCAGGWVNLKNELPSQLPLLVWFWAPH